MGLYKLFSCSLEVQYRSRLISKAMLFTIITTISTIIFPFIIAYQSKGFWLRTGKFFERASVYHTYDYLLLLETDDPLNPIICGSSSSPESINNQYCSALEVYEEKCNDSALNCNLYFDFHIILPPERVVTAAKIMLGLDYQINSVCPLHMQSLAFFNKEFSVPPSELRYFGDLEFYQITPLPCLKNTVDTEYNSSTFELMKNEETHFNTILDNYFSRKVTTQLKTIYALASSGHTGFLDIHCHIRIPETKVLYKPSLLQELRWAWPQYLSILIIFYWVINRIKKFVFNHRLLMAWEVLPGKKAL